MCPPCLQSLGEHTPFNDSQEESNTKGKGTGQTAQSWPCCGPAVMGEQRNSELAQPLDRTRLCQAAQPEAGGEDSEPRA